MQEKQVEAGLENAGPVSCATAEGDLRVLESDKAYIVQQVVPMSPSAEATNG